MILIVAWLACGIAAAIIGARKGEGLGGFILGVLLGPIGILIVAVSRGNRRECPACRELIHAAARICPHCRTEIGASSDKDRRSAPSSWRDAGIVLLAIIVGLLISWAVAMKVMP